MGFLITDQRCRRLLKIIVVVFYEGFQIQTFFLRFLLSSPHSVVPTRLRFDTSNDLPIAEVGYAAFPIALLCARLAGVVRDAQYADRADEAPLVASYRHPQAVEDLLAVGRQDGADVDAVRLLMREHGNGGWHGPTGIYRCHCGYTYGIGNCRRPDQEWPCHCGNMLGGRSHILNPGNRALSWEKVTEFVAPKPGLDDMEVSADEAFCLREMDPFSYRVSQLLHLMPFLIRRHVNFLGAKGQKRYALRFATHFKVYQKLTGTGKDDASVLLAKIVCEIQASFLYGASASGNAGGSAITEERRRAYEEEFQRCVRVAVRPNSADRRAPSRAEFADIVATMARSQKAMSETPALLDELSEDVIRKLSEGDGSDIGSSSSRSSSSSSGLSSLGGHRESDNGVAGASQGPSLERVRMFGSAVQLPIPTRDFAKRTCWKLRGIVWDQLLKRDQDLFPMYRVRKGKHTLHACFCIVRGECGIG